MAKDRIEQLEQKVEILEKALGEVCGAISSFIKFNELTTNAIETLTKYFTDSVDLIKSLPEDIAKEMKKQDDSDWWKSEQNG